MGAAPGFRFFCRDFGGGFVFVWLFGVGVAFAFLGVGARRERDGPARLALPWVPAKAGTTVGVGGPARVGGGVRGGSPILAFPHRGKGTRVRGGVPACRGSCLRGNDESGRPFDRLRANGVARGAGG